MMAFMPFVAIAAAMSAAVLVPSSARAQGLIAGSVTDIQRVGLVGASVIAQNEATHRRAETTTDRWGQYRLMSLRPGTYTLRFTLKGFERVSRHAISAVAGAATIANVELSPADPCAGVKTWDCASTLVVRGKPPRVSDGCEETPQTEECMTPRDVAATLPAAFKPLWIDHHSVSADAWAALPCESMSISVGSGLLFTPGASYTATFFRGGRAELKARDTIDTVVDYEGAVHIFYFGRLCLLAQRLGFDKLAPRYHSNVMDGGGYTVSVTIDGRRHQVNETSGSGPIELWGMETAIRSVKAEIDWKRQ